MFFASTPAPPGLLTQTISRSRTAGKVSMKLRQTSIIEQYRREPDASMVTDMAQTSSDDIAASCPLYGQVSLCHDGEARVPVGVHTAVGGNSDAPTPGDLLCGAIAACLDSTLRIFSNRVGLKLKKLEVTARGIVDVRGALRVEDSVPVAFQRFEIEVLINPRVPTPKKLIDKLIRTAEKSCIVIQTVRGVAQVTVARV